MISSRNLPKEESVWFEVFDVTNYLDLAVLIIKNIEFVKKRKGKQEFYKARINHEGTVVEFKIYEKDIKALAFDHLVKESPINVEARMHGVRNIFARDKFSFGNFSEQKMKMKLIKLSLINTYLND